LSRLHVDTDFLIYALGAAGPEREKLMLVAESSAEIQMSAVAWYEYARGPRSPELLAVARTFFGEHGIIPFSEALAEQAAAVFRHLGSPRKRAADIAIGVTAVSMKATLLTRNGRDFAGIDGLNLEVVTD
jgi:predicted nucleic acid-binding protein